MVSDAFVVVVVGGLGSIPGAFLAALLIGEIKAFCIGLGYSKLTLVAEFIVMAVVLVAAALGPARPAAGRARAAPPAEPCTSAQRKAACLPLVAALALVPLFSGGYALVLLTDVLVFALFAVSLHFLLGPGGMVSFGHAAYFGLGAYGAALLVLRAGLPMELALLVGAARRRRRRGALRLVLRAALRHLPRDADARIRADRVVGRVPVGRR